MLQGDLREAFQEAKKERDGLFGRVFCDRTRGNGFKLKWGDLDRIFRSDIRKKGSFFFFFEIEVVKHWQRLSGEVVTALSLEKFKVRLDLALSNIIYL